MDNVVRIGEKEYFTNDAGNGLFVWEAGASSYRQLVGTCDFTINNVKNKGAKIKRFVKNM